MRMRIRFANAFALTLGIAILRFASSRTGPYAQQTPGELKGTSHATITPANFRWQRTIALSLPNPLVEACVVLDPATFANAAPALRDLRLYQDGSELPFAIEQSFDERALRSGVTPLDDRSLYEVSAVAHLQPRLPGAAPGDSMLRNTRTHPPFKTGKIDPALGLYGHLLIPAHVPVERLRIDPAPIQTERLALRAREVDSAHLSESEERFDGNIGAGQAFLPFTLGTNLQNNADIFVSLDGSAQGMDRVIFEMRRRSLCYRPRSASPLTLYLGGGNSMPAESYAFARNFQSSNDRPYGRLGPLLPNLLFHPAAPRYFALSRNLRVTTAVLAFCAFLLFNTQRLLRKYKKHPAQ